MVKSNYTTSTCATWIKMAFPTNIPKTQPERRKRYWYKLVLDFDFANTIIDKKGNLPPNFPSWKTLMTRSNPRPEQYAIRLDATFIKSLHDLQTSLLTGTLAAFYSSLNHLSQEWFGEPALFTTTPDNDTTLTGTATRAVEDTQLFIFRYMATPLIDLITEFSFDCVARMYLEREHGTDASYFACGVWMMDWTCKHMPWIALQHEGASLGASLGAGAAAAYLADDGRLRIEEGSEKFAVEAFRLLDESQELIDWGRYMHH